MTDDLAPYLPDVNSIESSQVLETCAREFELGPKDPTEVGSLEDDNVSHKHQKNKETDFQIIFMQCLIFVVDFNQQYIFLTGPYIFVRLLHSRVRPLNYARS